MGCIGRLNGYNEIIKEYFNLMDRETRKTLISVNEADQNRILLALTSKLYDNIVNKVDDIDYGSIPNTKGDITKLENFDKLSECVEVMHQILSEYKQDTKPVDIVAEALGNIKIRKELFEKAFRYNIEIGMIIYSTVSLSIISSISFLIATCIEFIKSPSQDDFKVSLDNVSLARTKQNLLFNNLEKFNKICNTKELDKCLDFAIKNNVKGLIGVDDAGFIVTGIALVSIVLNILPIIRELIFFFYYSRVRVSDYFDIQADLLQMSAYALKNNDHTPIKKIDKERIAKKQLSIVSFFRKIADKLSIDNKQAEVTSTKEIQKAGKAEKNLKTSDILDSAPDSASSSSALF